MNLSTRNFDLSVENFKLKVENSELRVRNTDLERILEDDLMEIQTLKSEVEKNSDAPKQGENDLVADTSDNFLRLIGMICVESDEEWKR